MTSRDYAEAMGSALAYAHTFSAQRKLRARRRRRSPLPGLDDKQIVQAAADATTAVTTDFASFQKLYKDGAFPK